MTARRRKNNRKKNNTIPNGILRAIIGITLIFLGIYFLYAYMVLESGLVGVTVNLALSTLFGASSVIFDLLMITLGIIILFYRGEWHWRQVIGVCVVFVNITIAFSMFLPEINTFSIFSINSVVGFQSYGGIVGLFFALILINLLSYVGAVIFVVFTTILGFLLMINEVIKDWFDHYRNERRAKLKAKKMDKPHKKTQMKSENVLAKETKKNKNSKLINFEEIRKKEIKEEFEFEEQEIKRPEQKSDEPVIIHSAEMEEKQQEEKTIKPEQSEDEKKIHVSNISQENLHYELPGTHLLNQKKISKNNGKNSREVKEQIKKLEDTLKNFGVKAKVSEVTVGPTITRFEIQPESGVKVSKIKNLADDIALNMAATSIRIEAPIPGKAAVGIEIPNSETDMVTLRETLENTNFRKSESKISVALGKTITGKIVVADLTDMPHLLIAGATGSGKSVCINSIIMSILFKARPDEVKLILIDPKMVELNVYNEVPHLLIPVVTDPQKAANALNWAVHEMDDRYNNFKKTGVRDIKSYNMLAEENSSEKMPKVVVIIDELADLMMVAPKDCETAINRLAAKARAAGIHLVIATQRPSVDVITGVIKANIPSRIAFAVSSQTDSRTIIDCGGAEKLLGKGDMLYKPQGMNDSIRMQSAYVSDKEINRVVKVIKEQQLADYNEEMQENIQKLPELVQFELSKSNDPKIEEAIELAFNMNQLSTSMIQRKLGVGYARAGRIIDYLEEESIVSGANGSKPRTLLITREEYEIRKGSLGEDND
jgi:S-DNA-T family DNA segregation ATPase FtsK/SpoIIIE